MINHAYLELFNQSSIKKDIDIVYDTDSHITNSDIVSGTFSLNESAFATKELRFGSLVSSEMSAKLYNTVPNLMNKELDVNITLADDTSNALKIGKYKVLEDKPTTDRVYKQIKAYDSLYEVINKEVAEWYNGLIFPMSLKTFRNSLFVYLGIEQVDTTLVNDGMVVEKTINTNSISGKQVLSAICELNGAIGRMNRDGKFEYVILDANPSNRITIDNIASKSGSYEDFECQPITKVQIRQTTDDIGAIVGNDGNTYIMQDNFLVYGKSASDLSSIATNLLSVIEGISYTPFNIKAIYGNPCYEIGDAITVVTKNKTFNSYIFNRTLKGIQAMTDTIKADGVEYYTENLNNSNTQIEQLKRQTNELSRTVEETKSTITSIEKVADDANEMAQAALGNVAISNTAQGNSIFVEDSGNFPLIEFYGYGKSTQDGVPTSSTLVDIVSVADDGNLVVNTNNKNLLNPDTIEDGAINSTTGLDDNTNTVTIRTPYIKTKPNAQYITNSKIAVRVFFYTKTKEFISSIVVSSEVIKTPLNCEYIRLHTNKENTLFTTGFMLCEGTDATYVEHQSTQATIILNDSLRGIKVTEGGNFTDETGQQWVCDTLEKYADGSGKLVQMIGRDILNNLTSSKIQFESSVSTEDSVYYNLMDALTNKAIPNSNGLCNVLISTNSIWSNKTIEGFLLSNKWVGLRLNANRLTDTSDLEEVASYLNSLGMEIAYQLVEPIETPLSAEQIAEIEKLQTFNPITHITTDDIGDIAIKYYNNSANAEVVAKINDRVVKSESSITQNAKEIALKVSKGDVSSQLSVESEQVTISGNRLVVDADNFKLNADGSMECNNATVKGNITSEGQITLEQKDINITTILKTENTDITYPELNWDNGMTAISTFHNKPVVVIKNTNGIKVDGYLLSSDANINKLYASKLQGGSLYANNGYLGNVNAAGTIKTLGGLQSTSQYAFRSVYGDYGFMIFNPGDQTYFLLTNSGNQYGTYNSLRPLAINNSSGLVTMANGLTVSGGTLAANYLKAGPTNGTAIRLIRCGTTVVNLSGTSVGLLSLSTIQGWYSGATATNTAILVSNGDAGANGTHIESVSYLSGTWHVVVNGDTAKNGNLRINYTVICW